MHLHLGRRLQLQAQIKEENAAEQMSEMIRLK